jgi:RNA polymerase sigma factor (sigma-70 family)
LADADPTAADTPLPLSTFQALDRIASLLPFHLNDVEAVNRTYVRWQEEKLPETRRTVELWTYCFVLRYFLVKFSHESGGSQADIDEIVERCYERVERFSKRIEDPTRYASWVSVVCRNSYLNYLRARRREVSIDGDAAPLLVAETPAVYNDVGLIYQGLELAILRLPEFLREAAHLRFIEDCSYEEIARLTRKPVGTARTYVNKAARRLRKDSVLLAYLERPGEKDE